MNTAPKTQPPTRSPGERRWRTGFYLLSAVLMASALVDFDAGRFADGVGNLGAAVLMLSLIVQFPFIRAVLQASRESARPAAADQRRTALLAQVEKLRAAHPWADRAGRAGWMLLAVSLVLKIVGGF